jgi:hypothetical protein
MDHCYIITLAGFPVRTRVPNTIWDIILEGVVKTSVPCTGILRTAASLLDPEHGNTGNITVVCQITLNEYMVMYEEYIRSDVSLLLLTHNGYHVRPNTALAIRMNETDIPMPGSVSHPR